MNIREGSSPLSRKLIFVYNAKSGFTHGMMDLMHKTTNPKTYPCKLCMVTYSGATINKIWKRYVAGLGIPSVFLHRDEFVKVYPDLVVTFPAILLVGDHSMTMLISSKEFKGVADLPDLMNLLNKKLSETQHAKQYQCLECGLHYHDKETAKKCADWCKEYQSCNLDITKFSTENTKQPGIFTTET